MYDYDYLYCEYLWVYGFNAVCIYISLHWYINIYCIHYIAYHDITIHTHTLYIYTYTIYVHDDYTIYIYIQMIIIMNTNIMMISVSGRLVPGSTMTQPSLHGRCMTRWRAWARDQGVSLGCFWQHPQKWWFNGF